MSEQPGFIERIVGRVIDFIGDRWWLSLSAAAVSLVYPIYYFGFRSFEAYSSRQTKIAIALAVLGFALAYLGWLSLTSPSAEGPDLEKD
jgi:hypothetical protein